VRKHHRPGRRYSLNSSNGLYGKTNATTTRPSGFTAFLIRSKSLAGSLQRSNRFRQDTTSNFCPCVHHESASNRLGDRIEHDLIRPVLAVHLLSARTTRGARQKTSRASRPARRQSTKTDQHSESPVAAFTRRRARWALATASSAGHASPLLLSRHMGLIVWHHQAVGRPGPWTPVIVPSILRRPGAPTPSLPALAVFPGLDPGGGTGNARAGPDPRTASPVPRLRTSQLTSREVPIGCGTDVYVRRRLTRNSCFFVNRKT